MYFNYSGRSRQGFPVEKAQSGSSLPSRDWGDGWSQGLQRTSFLSMVQFLQSEEVLVI